MRPDISLNKNQNQIGVVLGIDRRHKISQARLKLLLLQHYAGMKLDPTRKTADIFMAATL